MCEQCLYDYLSTQKMHQEITVVIVDELPDNVRTDLCDVNMSTVVADGNIVWSCETLATSVHRTTALLI